MPLLGSTHSGKSHADPLLRFLLITTHRSPAVSIGDIGTDYFRLQTPNVPDAIRLVKCTVEVEGPTIFVTLTSADREWPFKIVNDSQYPVALSQKVGFFVRIVFTPLIRPLLQVEEGVKAGPQYNIPARASLEYAWDFPAALIKRLDLTINGSHRNIDPKEIGNLVPFKFKVCQSVLLRRAG